MKPIKDNVKQENSVMTEKERKRKNREAIRQLNNAIMVEDFYPEVSDECAEEEDDEPLEILTDEVSIKEAIKEVNKKMGIVHARLLKKPSVKNVVLFSVLAALTVFLSFAIIFSGQIYILFGLIFLVLITVPIGFTTFFSPRTDVYRIKQNRKHFMFFVSKKQLIYYKNGSPCVLIKNGRFSCFFAEKYMNARLGFQHMVGNLSITKGKHGRGTEITAINSDSLKLHKAKLCLDDGGYPESITADQNHSLQFLSFDENMTVVLPALLKESCRILKIPLPEENKNIVFAEEETPLERQEEIITADGSKVSLTESANKTVTLLKDTYESTQSAEGELKTNTSLLCALGALCTAILGVFFGILFCVTITKNLPIILYVIFAFATLLLFGACVVNAIGFVSSKRIKISFSFFQEGGESYFFIRHGERIICHTKRVGVEMNLKKGTYKKLKPLKELLTPKDYVYLVCESMKDGFCVKMKNPHFKRPTKRYFTFSPYNFKLFFGGNKQLCSVSFKGHWQAVINEINSKSFCVEMPKRFAGALKRFGAPLPQTDYIRLTQQEYNGQTEGVEDENS